MLKDELTQMKEVQEGGTENTEGEKNIPKPRGNNKRQKLLVQNRHFGFTVFFPHILYLPAEAGEEDLIVLVFVLQLLGNADEAGAGLRAVSHLQSSKDSTITRSPLMPRATVQRRHRNVSRC